MSIMMSDSNEWRESQNHIQQKSRCYNCLQHMVNTFIEIQGIRSDNSNSSEYHGQGIWPKWRWICTTRIADQDIHQYLQSYSLSRINNWELYILSNVFFRMIEIEEASQFVHLTWHTKWKVKYFLFIEHIGEFKHHL